MNRLYWSVVFLVMMFLALAQGELYPAAFALGFLLLVILLQYTDGDPP